MCIVLQLLRAVIVSFCGTHLMHSGTLIGRNCSCSQNVQNGIHQQFSRALYFLLTAKICNVSFCGAHLMYSGTYKINYFNNKERLLFSKLCRKVYFTQSVLLLQTVQCSKRAYCLFTAKNTYSQFLWYTFNVCRDSVCLKGLSMFEGQYNVV